MQNTVSKAVSPSNMGSRQFQFFFPQQKKNDPSEQQCSSAGVTNRQVASSLSSKNRQSDSIKTISGQTTLAIQNNNQAIQSSIFKQKQATSGHQHSISETTIPKKKGPNHLQVEIKIDSNNMNSNLSPLSTPLTNRNNLTSSLSNTLRPKIISHKEDISNFNGFISNQVSKPHNNQINPQNGISSPCLHDNLSPQMKGQEEETIINASNNNSNSNHNNIHNNNNNNPQNGTFQINRKSLNLLTCNFLINQENPNTIQAQTATNRYLNFNNELPSPILNKYSSPASSTHNILQQTQFHSSTFLSNKNNNNNKGSSHNYFKQQKQFGSQSSIISPLAIQTQLKENGSNNNSATQIQEHKRTASGSGLYLLKIDKKLQYKKQKSIDKLSQSLKQSPNMKLDNAAELKAWQVAQQYFDSNEQQQKQKDTSKVLSNQQDQSLKELNIESQVQLGRLEEIGFLKYINSVFIDCEYLFKDEMKKQRISANDLASTFLKGNNYYSNNHKVIKDKEKDEDMPEGILAIKRDVEKGLSVAICRKRNRTEKSVDFLNSQMQEAEDILKSGLKRVLKQVHADARQVFAEMTGSILLLQSKKHILFEKKRRDDAAQFLLGVKDKEKEFGIELFGKEEQVESFRIKIGEIMVENQKLQRQYDEIEKLNKASTEQLQKQKKLNNLMKNEYLIMKNLTKDLQMRLHQKLSSYAKKFKKNQKRDSILIDQDEQLDTGVETHLIKDKHPKKVHNTDSDKTSELESRSHNQKETNQSLVSSTSTIEEECDIEEFLRQAQEFTKIEQNHEVVIKEIRDDIPTLFYNQSTQTDPKITEPKREINNLSIQTELKLIDYRFDRVLKNNQVLEQIKQQEEMKEQLANLSHLHSEDSENNDDELEDHVSDNLQSPTIIKKNTLLDNFTQATPATGAQTSQQSTSPSEPSYKSKFRAVELRLRRRISIITILKGLPMERRSKKIEKNDIESLEENIHVLKNFLKQEESETSIAMGEETQELPNIAFENNNNNRNNSPERNNNFNSEATSYDFRSRQISKTSAQDASALNTNQAGSNSKAKIIEKKALNSKKQQKDQIAFVNKVNSSKQTLVDIPNTSLVNTNINTNNNFNTNSPNSKKSLKNFEEGQQQSIMQIQSNQQYGQKEQFVQQDTSKQIIRPSLVMEKRSSQLKDQVLSLVKLYNLEVEKSKNYEESIDQLLKIMQELFNFCYKIYIHVERTQKDTYKSIVEQFFQIFTAIRWKLPKEIDQNLEEDLYPQEALKKKLQKKQMQHSGTKSSLNRQSGIMFGQKQANKMTVQDKSVHPGVVLTKKLREVGLPKKFSNFMPLKSVVKVITQIFEERERQVEENRLSKDTELSIFVFSRFIHQFGFKHVAEQKFLHFLMNVLHYNQIFRVNIFSKLICLMPNEDDNYCIDEMDTYISGWNFLVSGSTMGSAIPFTESDLKINAHFLRVLDLLKLKLEKVLPPEHILELKQFAESQKESTVGGKAVVDVDQFLFKVLQKYHIMLNSTKLSVKGAFLACDLDGNGTINLTEFLTLYRHIESEKFQLTKACKLFQQSADIITPESKALSFTKFTSVCLQYRLFLDQQQRKFLQIYEKYEIEQQLNELRNNWNEEKKQISQSIDSLKPFVQPETFVIWKKVLLVLEDRILQKEVISEQEKESEHQQSQKKGTNVQSLNNPTLQQLQNESRSNLMSVLIAHKLLKQELKRLLDAGQTEDFNLQDSDTNSDSDEESGDQDDSLSKQEEERQITIDLLERVDKEEKNNQNQIDFTIKASPNYDITQTPNQGEFSKSQLTSSNSINVNNLNASNNNNNNNNNNGNSNSNSNSNGVSRVNSSKNITTRKKGSDQNLKKGNK